VEDVLHTSEERLARHQPASPEEVRCAPERMVDISPALRANLEPFRAFLFKHVYLNPIVADDSHQAVHMMRRLFLHYIEHPETMGRKARARLPAEGLWRTACDYVAGMTDRYALEEVQRFGLADQPAAGEPA